MTLHPLCGGAPEQKRWIAYGSGAAPQHTRTNAELAHRTTHRHTPPCAPGPYWRQDGHAAHATHAATCTPAHSNTSHTLTCKEPVTLDASGSSQQDFMYGLAQSALNNAKSGLVWFCGPGVLRVVGCYWWCCAHWCAYWLGESQPSALWGCSSL